MLPMRQTTASWSPAGWQANPEQMDMDPGVGCGERLQSVASLPGYFHVLHDKEMLRGLVIPYCRKPLCIYKTGPAAEMPGGRAAWRSVSTKAMRRPRKAVYHHTEIIEHHLRGRTVVLVGSLKVSLNEWQLTNQVSLYRQNVLPRARSHARSCEDYRHGAGGRSTVPAVRPQRVNASAREESALYVSFWQIQNNPSLYTNLFAHHVQRHVRRAVGNESDALRDCQPPARRPVLIPRERLSCGSTRFVGVPPAALT